MRFIQNEADEANSLYGKILYGRPKEREPTVPEPGVKRSAVLSTVAATQPIEKTDVKCPFCKGSHYLSGCEIFQKMQWYKRLAFLRREKRCFRCLEVGLDMS